MATNRTPPVKVCPECMREHREKRRRFCCPEHRTAWNNRPKASANAIVPLLKAWVAGKGGGHRGSHPLAMQAMRELTQIARELINDDKEAGRMAPLDYAEILMANGSRHFDRRRG